MITSKANITFAGIKEETTFKTNPIPDFTDAGDPKCNPVVMSDSAYSITPNAVDENFVKSLNGNFAGSGGDWQQGKENYTLSINGNVFDNGFGFIAAPYHQVREWDGVETEMVYRLEDNDIVCAVPSYTLWFPRGCGSSAQAVVAEIVTGAKPTTLSIDWNAGTYTAEFMCATYDPNVTVAAQMPVYDNGDYNFDSNLFARFRANAGKLSHTDGLQITNVLSTNITIEYDETVGFYNSAGVMDVEPIVSNITCTVAYESPYDTVASTTNKTNTLLGTFNKNDEITGYGTDYTKDSTHYIRSTFNAKITDQNPDQAGELMNFGCTFNTINDIANGRTANTYEMRIADSFGDITSVL